MSSPLVSALQNACESITPGVTDKLATLRREAELRAREWRRYGHEFEAIEWETAAKWLGAIA